jgi:hypothetical protein
MTFPTQMALPSGSMHKRCGPFHSNDFEYSKFPWGEVKKAPIRRRSKKNCTLSYFNMLPTLVCCDLHKVKVPSRSLKKAHSLPRFIHLHSLVGLQNYRKLEFLLETVQFLKAP